MKKQLLFFSGVAAGSIAAGVQSAVYGGATTGVFSVLQSAGAVELSTAAQAGVATAGGVFTGGLSSWFTASSKEKNPQENNAKETNAQEKKAK